MHKVYMIDPWADPMMVKLGEYRSGDEVDWSEFYDAAMECHIIRQSERSRYGD